MTWMIEETSSADLVNLAIFITLRMSFEPSSFHTFSAIVIATYMSIFSYESISIAIFVNSLKVYSGTGNTRNRDNIGSINFSLLLAVAKTQDVKFICLVFLILVSDIIPVSIKCNKDIWSTLFIFSNSSTNRYFGLFSNN